MSTRHNDLTPEELDRQRALDRSWETAQQVLNDPEFRDYLEGAVERVKLASAAPISRDEFLAQTEAAAE